MDGRGGKWPYLLPLLVFATIFIFYTYPLGLSDFWWHMSSGRWIWEHGAIPSVDQFTYTYPQDDDTRRTVILQAYYLGQLSFYFCYTWFGVWGLLLYKAALLTLPLWLLWRYLRFKQVDNVIALILLLPLPMLLHRFDELRAVVFSFIGAIAVLYLVELLLDRLRKAEAIRGCALLLLLTMLLWANLHRGFLIGWVLLAGYLGFETLKFLRPGFPTPAAALPKAALIKLALVCVAAVLISFINPNGWNAIFANSTELDGPFMQVIDEYFPLWTYFSLYDQRWVFYACVAIVLAGGYVMIRARRNLHWAHAFLFAGFAYQGIATFRFSYFLVVMCLALAAPYFQPVGNALMQRYPRPVYAVGLTVLLAVAGLSVQRSAFVTGPWEGRFFPAAAAEFIRKNHLPANVFNAFEYGGYLGWRLSPDYKIFIDQRNLDYDVYREYARARTGDYEGVFSKYNVNTVVFYIRQPVLGKVPRIIAALLDDWRWGVAYIDPVAIVFVNKRAATQLPVLDRGRVIEYINSLTTKR